MTAFEEGGEKGHFSLERNTLLSIHGLSSSLTPNAATLLLVVLVLAGLFVLGLAASVIFLALATP
jgi:hypothetical protein